MSVATSTAIGIAVAAGTAGAGIYAANKSSGAAENAATTQAGAAEKVANTQSTAATTAAQLQAQSAAQALQFSREQSQVSLDQYNQQQQRLQPYRNLGNFALGLPNDAAPAPIQLPSLPGSTNLPSSAIGQTSTSLPSGAQGVTQSSDPAAYALSLVQGGMPPDQAAKQTNQKFNLQTGSQAVYYQDSNTIGLPNAYLAGPTGKADSPASWGIVPRSTGGSAATAGATTPNQKVTLGFSPQALPNASSSSIPLTPALQAPQIQSPYQSLGTMGQTY